jgi:hypothetical protein
MSMNYRDALNGPADDLTRFDTAAGGDDLANFDNASGQTHVPPGWYCCTVVRGELRPTKKTGKPGYRLAVEIADGPDKGFRVARTYTFDTAYAANLAKYALGPLGLRTGADLRKPFPAPGRTIIVRVFLTVGEWEGRPKNDLERLELVEDRPAAANPNAVSLDGFTTEGGTQ